MNRRIWRALWHLTRMLFVLAVFISAIVGSLLTVAWVIEHSK
jgi:hypothetical protein